MSERDQGGHAAPAAPDGSGYQPVPDSAWRDQTTPGISPVQHEGASGGGSTAVGSGGHGYPGASENYYTSPQYSTAPVAIRRGDAFAALLLILAGIAAGVSLLLQWLRGSDVKGWDILKDGFTALGDDVGSFFSDGFWEPLAIVLGGGVLFVIGLLLLIPAKAHRTLGLLALLVSCGVIAGVLVPLADGGWNLGDWRVGFYFAMAVAVLGLLGSLKALLTGPKYGAPRQ
jgi:hypothetical protein